MTGPNLSFADVVREANKFLGAYHPSLSLPIPIEQIVNSRQEKVIHRWLVGFVGLVYRDSLLILKSEDNIVALDINNQSEKHKIFDI